ncbi:hypothetical protein HanHA300_Chr08g0277411 [Helianthus annuus]|nr:hypothetical protein HanHA300_Chr08g0277411 [Helianthus annuus]
MGIKFDSMLIQQDRDSKPSNPKSSSLPTTLRSNQFSPSKSLDFSTWLFENLYKIVTIVVLIAAVIAVFFLRNVGEFAALLCFQSQTQQVETIHFPQINCNFIAHVVDKSSQFASCRSEQWIVVSLSSYPTDSVRKLVRLRGGRFLRLGIRKPRVIGVLKNVGYLFAIQHGAKKIFDADDQMIGKGD